MIGLGVFAINQILLVEYTRFSKGELGTGGFLLSDYLFSVAFLTVGRSGCLDFLEQWRGILRLVGWWKLCDSFNNGDAYNESNSQEDEQSPCVFFN